MIKPHLQGESFLSDISNADNLKNGLHLWWIGQSGFLIKWNNYHLLFDPYLSDSLSRKYAATDKPHTRMTEQVVQIAQDGSSKEPRCPSQDNLGRYVYHFC